MLVLTRKVGERIIIGDGIIVAVNRVAGNRVTLGIDAPDNVRIMRGEIEPVVHAFGREGESCPKGGTPFSDETDVANASVPRLAK